MRCSRASGIRVSSFFLLSVLVCALSGSAATSQLQVLLDTDQNAASGCTVATPEGAFPGVERILAATVTTCPPARVTALDLRSCSAAGLFGPPAAVPLPAGEGAIGIGNGTGGAHVVEACLPTNAFAASPSSWSRVGLLSSNDSGGQDALLTRAPGSPEPILLSFLPLPKVPAVSGWGLVALALLLGGAAATRLRKGPAAAGLFALSTLSIGVGAAAAIPAIAAVVADGQTADWTAGDILAGDLPGDAPAGVDLRALFGKVEAGRLCFRIDTALSMPAPLSADDQTVVTSPDTPVAIELAGTFSCGAPTFKILGGPWNGTLSGTVPHLTYTPHPGYVGPDSLNFEVSDSAGNTDGGLVTIYVS